LFAEFDTHTRVIIGLRLPDGKVIWPPHTWHGHDTNTPEGRKDITEAIRAAADNLGINAEELLAGYQWVSRVDTVYVTVVPQTDSSAYGQWPVTTEPLEIATPDD